MPNVLGAIWRLHELDRDLTLSINGLHSMFTDQFWQFCSDKIAWIPLYAIAIVFLVRSIGWKKTLIYLAAIGIGFLLCDQISNFVKDTVGRLRPNYDAEAVRRGLNVLESRGGKYGFFSAHAANAFCAAILFHKALKTGCPPRLATPVLAFVIYSWATLVAISRIFVGKHFLGDVIVGTLVGLAIGSLVAVFVAWISSRIRGLDGQAGNTVKA